MVQDIVAGYDVTVTNGTTTETYNNIAGTGTSSPTFWTNLANAINAGTPKSTLVMATTLGGTGNPVDGTALTLSGGASTAGAYAQDQVAIDTSETLKYGVNSNQKGFQQLILGLRFAYAATQDTTNYSADMAQASSLITSGLTAIRSIHTGVSSANTTLTQVQTAENASITSLQNQASSIQDADITTISAEITAFQVNLEASYAATAKMTSLSILKYL